MAWYFRSGRAGKRTPDILNQLIGVAVALEWALGEGAPENPMDEMLVFIAYSCSQAGEAGSLRVRDRNARPAGPDNEPGPGTG